MDQWSSRRGQSRKKPHRTISSTMAPLCVLQEVAWRWQRLISHTSLSPSRYCASDYDLTILCLRRLCPWYIDLVPSSQMRRFSRSYLRILNHRLHTCIRCMWPAFLIFTSTTLATILQLNSEGQVPHHFKSAVVTPLLKKDGLDPDDLNNFRPISIISLISKILERLVQSSV